MFAPYLVDAWIVAGIVAVMAGVVGFFVVARGGTFEAHTLPLCAFPGGAAATLLGVSEYAGLLVFALAAVLAIVLLGRGNGRQVATALALVLLLALGSLFLSLTREYAPAVYALLFGELLGVGPGALRAVLAMAVMSVAATALLFRPLLLDTLSSDLAVARGVPVGLVQTLFLLDVAVVSAAALPVVGALLVFALMVGPPSAARAFVDRASWAVMLSVAFAFADVWSALALSIATDWPVGFFVGANGVLLYGAGRLARARRTPRRRDVSPDGQRLPPI